MIKEVSYTTIPVIMSAELSKFDFFMQTFLGRQYWKRKNSSQNDSNESIFKKARGQKIQN